VCVIVTISRLFILYKGEITVFLLSFSLVKTKVFSSNVTALGIPKIFFWFISLPVYEDNTGIVIGKYFSAALFVYKACKKKLDICSH
jgi:hypothetical protein